MGLNLNNVACGDGYSDAATLGPVPNTTALTFTVANNSAIAQVAGKGIPQEDWGPEVLIPPVTGAQVLNANGIRFRNAVAGNIARVVAELSQPFDPVILGGTPFTGILASTGGVNAGGVLTGMVDGAGNITGGTGFSVVHTATGVYTVTFTTAFANPPTVIPTVNDWTAALSYVAQPTNITSTGFTLHVSTGGGTLQDHPFNFIAAPTV